MVEKRGRGRVGAYAAALVAGGMGMISQTLLLRRFLWRFEVAESGVALFLAGWLLWSGLGAALAASVAKGVSRWLSKRLWVALMAIVIFYFIQYELYASLRSLLGAASFETLSLRRLLVGCLVANAPYSLVAGFAMPAICIRLAGSGVPISRAFAWEALGAGIGGMTLTFLLINGISPDPRDAREWQRFFPDATVTPGRFETGGGTTLYGGHGNTFYAVRSGGVAEILPEGDRAVDVAMLILAQRPYARRILLFGGVPLAVGMAVESMQPDSEVVWSPFDALYGSRVVEAVREAELKCGVRASELEPQVLLDDPEYQGYFDVVVIVPPAAASSEGAIWRSSGFARKVKGLIPRTGVVLYSLGLEGMGLTSEAAMLLRTTVCSIRDAWPEGGRLIGGCGGWWVTAKVSNLVYGVEDGVRRFAMLKLEEYPAESLRLLYDPIRTGSLIESCPELDVEHIVEPWEGNELFDLRRAGIEATLRKVAPANAPGPWCDLLQSARGVRLVTLGIMLFLLLGMVGWRRAGVEGRCALAWLATSGGMGLISLLGMLHWIEVRFGSLYLMVGAAGCLFLCGMFLGNRIMGELVVRLSGRHGWYRFAAVGVSILQVAVLRWSWLGAEQLDRLYLVVGLSLLPGIAAGGVMPIAAALYRSDGNEHGGAQLVMSDAIGGAVAGIVYLVMSPFSGLWGTALIVVLCMLGLALFQLLCSRDNMRWSILLSLVLVAVLWGRLLRQGGGNHTPARWEEVLSCKNILPERARESSEGRGEDLVGVPRRLDEDVIRSKQSRGSLSTNEAAFWR